MSFEQTHKRLERSSTSTPNVDRLSKAPGLIHGSAFEAPGLMRAMPPEARLLTFQFLVGDLARMRFQSDGARFGNANRVFSEFFTFVSQGRAGQEQS
jgi:hypothetical protein